MDGIDVRVSPWPGEVESCLVSARMGSLLHLLTEEPLSTIRQIASRSGYERLLWQSSDDLSETTFKRMGFEERDRLHVLVAWDLKIPFPEPVTDLSVRRARPSDIESVLEIDHQCFEPFWQLDPQGIEEAILATPRSRYRVLTHRHNPAEVLGYAIFGQGSGAGYLQRIAVTPLRQRSGGATALVSDGFHWLKRWRAQKVSVNTQVTNAKALSLYLKLGFNLQRRGLSLYQCSVSPN